jgi:hypothetical protein
MSNEQIDEQTNEITSRAIGTNSSNTRGTLGETPVANINYHIWRPFPSTNQVLMVYNRGDSGTVQIESTSQAVQQLTFRLNAINDIETPYNYVVNADAQTSDAITGTPTVPSMRNFWSTVYQYYTVVRSRYHFRIRPANATGNPVGELDVYQHMHGVQAPPLVYGANKAIPWQYRKRFPQTICKKVRSKPNGTASGSDNHFLDFFTDFYGEWHPGTIKHPIEEDENRKNWIKMNNIPPTPEFLSFVIQRSSASSAAEIPYIWEMSIEYEVQLKDLLTQYEFIRPDITISTDPVDVGVYTPASANVYDQGAIRPVP